MNTFQNKTVLITGANSGIGEAAAASFAREGAATFAIVRRPDALEAARHKHPNIRWLLGDVSKPDDLKAAVRTAVEQTGRLDVLVNNAAVTRFIPHSDLDTLTESVWDEILGVNLKGPYFCIKAALPLLKQSDAPAVVNVSSVAGLGGEGSSVAYAASKGALNTMTKSLARALAPVRVNAVCPGPIDSRWLRNVMSEEQLHKRVEGYPIPRPAQPDDIADAILYLATGTSMTTGQCLVLDGGRTM